MVDHQRIEDYATLKTSSCPATRVRLRRPGRKLVPGIHGFANGKEEIVDGRARPGHDGDRAFEFNSRDIAAASLPAFNTPRPWQDQLIPVAEPGHAFMLGAMDAAEDGVAVLDAVPNNAAAAMSTGWRERLDRAFE